MDVAAADISCSDKVCVCKHALICKTPDTLQKLRNKTPREQLVISGPSSKHRQAKSPPHAAFNPSLRRLSPLPHNGATNMSMTAITKSEIKPTTAMCLVPTCTHACAAARQPGDGVKYFLLISSSVDSTCLRFVSQLVSLQTRLVSLSFIPPGSCWRRPR